MIRALALSIGCLAGPALALDIDLPANARQTVERRTAIDIFHAPAGVFQDGAVPEIKVEGDVLRRAWRIGTSGLTALQVMRPLRDQLASSGFDIILDCDAAACGGFDFRFAIETLPGPNMYINIRDFHVVSGTITREGKVVDVVTLITSGAATSAYVQMIHAGASVADSVPAPLPERSQPARPTTTIDIAAELQAHGHAVLSDLDFETGSTELGAGPFRSLADLAAFLKGAPETRVALVGHTDTVGGLDGNIAISRARAQSVRQRLITEFNLAPNRLDAEGMGYLSPVASNLDAAGRDQNRRVEVVLLGPL